MDIEATIRGYLPDILHMSLATCAGGKPWVCEVHYAYDSDLNLYFASTAARRHSQEIAANPNVAGNIITQHDLGQAPRGVYFEGTAKPLPPDPDQPAFKLYTGRLKNADWLHSDFAKPDGHRLYQISVSDYYVFDARETKPANKLHLPWGPKK